MRTTHVGFIVDFENKLIRNENNISVGGQLFDNVNKFKYLGSCEITGEPRRISLDAGPD